MGADSDVTASDQNNNRFTPLHLASDDGELQARQITDPVRYRRECARQEEFDTVAL
jgi:hypothetical protein